MRRCIRSELTGCAEDRQEQPRQQPRLRPAVAVRRTSAFNRTTCLSICVGSEYGTDELEFLKAIEEYKRAHRRPFPSWTEVLCIAKSLGWRKASQPDRR